jgi:hypothetical protein
MSVLALAADLRRHWKKKAERRTMTLKWRTSGALQGGARGVLAMVPFAGSLAAITLDMVAMHVLSTAVATRRWRMNFVLNGRIVELEDATVRARVLPSPAGASYSAV